MNIGKMLNNILYSAFSALEQIHRNLVTNIKQLYIGYKIALIWTVEAVTFKQILSECV